MAADEAKPPSVRRSVALSFAARGSSAVITLATGMILARLLTPAETGIYAVGLAVMMFLEVLREFGVGSYLIQERQLDRQKIRAAFTITLLIAWSAGGLLAAVSRPLADFYGEPQLALVLWVLCLGFLLVPFGAPTMGLLHREMRFGALYTITIGGTAAFGAVAVALAWLGFGPVSLAWGAVAGSAVKSVLAILSRPADALVWPTFRGLRPVLRFGAQTTGASLLIQVVESATPLLTGRLLGFVDTGLFGRANGLISQVRGNLVVALGMVAHPAFARRGRAGEELREPFLRSGSLVSGLAWPLLAFLMLMAFPLFRLLFGPQWDAAVPLFQILIVGEALFALMPFAGTLMLGLGRADVFLKGEIVIQCSRLAMIAVAALHSIEAVCVAEVLHYLAFFVVYSFLLPPLIHLTPAAVLRSHGRSVLVTIITLAGPACAFVFFDDFSVAPWQPLGVAVLTSGLAWLFGILVVKHPLASEVERVFTSLCHYVGQRQLTVRTGIKQRFVRP